MARSPFGSNEPARRPGYRRLRYWADEHDGRGYARHSRTIRGTKRDGWDELARIRLSHGRDAPCPTVGQAWETWVVPEMDRRLEAYLADPVGTPPGERVKPSTYRGRMSIWRNHVGPRWARVPLSDVRALDVQAWLDGMEVGHGTVRLAFYMLRDILSKGVKYDVLPRNVLLDTSDWDLPSAPSRRADVWTLDELVYGLWPQMWGSPVEGAFILAAFGSCRPGESLAPTVDEVRLVEREGMSIALVPIVRQVDDRGVPTMDGDMKNGWSPRTIAIPEPWSLRLDELCGDREMRPVWLTDRCGEPWRRGALADELRAAEVRAGLPHKEPRALRRSWRSWMATETDIPEEVLEKMMGHVGHGVTGRHYLAMTEESLLSTVFRAFSERPISVDWDKLGHKVRGV